MTKAHLRGLLLILTFFIGHLSLGQILKPIKWDKPQLSVETPEAGGEYDLIFTAKIDEDWYLYSSDFDPDLGPMVTRFNFEPNDTYELIGEINPINPSRKYDSVVWMGEYTYFKKTAEFRQRIKILKADYRISGNYTYQVCTDVDGKCIPFDDDFSLNTHSKEEEGVADTPHVVKKKRLSAKGTHDPYTLLSFMLVSFLAGLAALLTPCVFPMIPMTVSFFTGKKKERSKSVFQAVFYGISIIVIYVLVGVILAPFMGPETANDLATGWIPNVIFFTVFVVFALSFFGLFEITLPHKWVNQADRMGDKGGIIGIFFMALTLVLVSFSCTGPLVGSILVESAGGQFLKPILGMLAFALAFALPFTLFALFPGLLNNLPKSGSWLNSVKVVLGFLELAFAFKFLSVADQAYHWHILDREIYLAIWIVIFTLLGFYLLGKIKLPGDGDESKTSVGKLIMAILTFSFVVYLIPGMFGAPLKALAGYLPPLSTHDFNLYETGEVQEPLCEEPKYSSFLEWAHGLNGYFDYDQALACARSQNKPLFIDFTGHGCVNCREMEQRVWSDPKILELLKNEFVLVALYVDDKTELPESEWYTSQYDNKVKKSIGKQNADFQITEFENNAQPFYVILSPEGKLLVNPQAYDLNVDNFASFLKKGINAYQQNK
ncbi:cytochrome c biogenesis protein CcdA [Marinoscillum sp. MHG1-6]|uniref:protein-disulfide reductase DsbD family protein n=1 Tax=Marinoscillum sp. MHG1-6 TaxID=2959627 RepID=UPI0021578093|nr:cytochrome c biogenesis protein CcdA [Marinoscillum sp. MHG1-6]